MAYSLLIKNCGQLLTMRGKYPKKGRAMSDLGVVRNGFVACEGGCIADVGLIGKLKRSLITAKTKVIDAEGKVVMPGLIDCHTHLVFAGSRAGDFEKKLAGKSYLEILRSGGGILSTVKATRRASKSGLLRGALGHLKDMLCYGVTTVEIKSGYGLDLATELKILEVIHEAGKKQPVRLVATFLGAHAVPAEYRGKPQRYLDFLMKKVLPRVKGKADFVDIFCERGAFDLKQAGDYLRCASGFGFKLKIHGEQLNDLGACGMAVELGAVSCDHCDHLNAGDIKKLSKKNTVMVLLPVVPLYLRESVYADGRKMVDEGLAVAVSTDFNPGSAPSKNIFLAMGLACLKMGLTVEEVLTAVTINAACALDLGADRGSLVTGKMADIVIMNTRDYREIPYFFAENLVKNVFVGGSCVF